MKALISGALGATLLFVSLGSQAQLSVEDQIKYRQSGYAFMSWNMGKIKAQVIDGEVAYDQAQVAAAANAIAAIANSGMGALYSPDSARDKAKNTRLKPEFFANLGEAGQIGKRFNEAANNLAKVAASGDQAEIRNAFGALGQSCKACHDKFRSN